MLDETDKKIINHIQSDFPISKMPYAVIAKRLDLEEIDVIKRLSELKKKGLIRRIGGNFGPEKLGFTSTLCAARVSMDRLDLFTEVVNSYSGVTHNYIRENSFNVWFTFIAQSREIIEKNLADISKKTGVTEILNLPATEVFKIKALFKV